MMGPESASLYCFPFLSHLRLPFWPPHQESVAEIQKVYILVAQAIGLAARSAGEGKPSPLFSHTAWFFLQCVNCRPASKALVPTIVAPPRPSLHISIMCLWNLGAN